MITNTRILIVIINVRTPPIAVTLIMATLSELSLDAGIGRAVMTINKFK